MFHVLKHLSHLLVCEGLKVSDPTPLFIFQPWNLKLGLSDSFSGLKHSYTVFQQSSDDVLKMIVVKTREP